MAERRVIYDSAGTAHTDCLYHPGFPTILWETLQIFGFTEPPSYRGLHHDEERGWTNTAFVTISAHPSREDWPSVTRRGFGCTLDEAFDSAAFLALTMFCEENLIEVAGQLPELFPIRDQTNHHWNRRLRSWEDASRADYNPRVATSVRYSLSLRGMYDGLWNHYHTVTAHFQSSLLAAREQLDGVTRQLRNLRIWSTERLQAAEAARDQAVAQTEQAFAQRDQAFTQRDQAFTQRDQAFAQRDWAVEEMQNLQHQLHFAHQLINAGLNVQHQMQQQQAQPEEEEEPTEIQGMSGASTTARPEDLVATAGSEGSVNQPPPPPEEPEQQGPAEPVMFRVDMPNVPRVLERLRSAGIDPSELLWFQPRQQ